MNPAESLALVALLFAVLALPYWMVGRRKRAQTRGVSNELRARLGEALAELLVATRALRVELVELERIIRGELEAERRARLPSGFRPSSEMADANFLADLRKARAASGTWRSRAEALESADLQRYEIEREVMHELLTLAWPWESSATRVADRSAALSRLLTDCHQASEALAGIDARLSATPESPYR